MAFVMPACSWRGFKADHSWRYRPALHVGGFVVSPFVKQRRFDRCFQGVRSKPQQKWLHAFREQSNKSESIQIMTANTLKQANKVKSIEAPIFWIAGFIQDEWWIIASTLQALIFSLSRGFSMNWKSYDFKTDDIQHPTITRLSWPGFWYGLMELWFVCWLFPYRYWLHTVCTSNTHFDFGLACLNPFPGCAVCAILRCCCPRSEYFDAHLHMHYLLRMEQSGVQDYLVSWPMGLMTCSGSILAS